MCELTINISVKNINLVLNVKLTTIEKFKKNLEDAINETIIEFTTNNSYDENKRIIEEVYEKEIIDLIYEYDMANDMPRYSKEFAIGLMTFYLIKNDINKNLKEKIIENKVKYIRLEVKKLVKSLTNESLSENKKDKIENKIKQLLDTLLKNNDE